ncbi:hypothetical protein SpCBS45565_g01501 [Spizellomyces sp. 'palustris']|nr:hypothetical protein SpCBS45565_g01501 [Spizellomyces sp. 'palustris']
MSDAEMPSTTSATTSPPTSPAFPPTNMPSSPPPSTKRPPPPIPPRPPSLARRNIRQRARLSVASRTSRTRSILSGIDWKSQPEDVVLPPPMSPRSEVDRAEAEIARKQNGNGTPVGGLVTVLTPDSPSRTPTPKPAIDTLRRSDYFTSKPLSPPPRSEASTPRTSPSRPVHLLRRLSSHPTSWRSSLFRRSGVSPNGSLKMTGEEAILSNVFGGCLSPEIAETLLEDDEMEVVPVYSAIALYDFEPDEGFADMVPLKAGERVVVYGKRNVRNTVLSSPDFMEDWDCAKEVEVADGWCQVELENAATGFAPVSYLMFSSDTTPLETQQEVELAVADAAPDTAGFQPSDYIPVLRHQPSFDETIGVRPSHRIVEQFLNGLREPSIASIGIDNLSYPSAMSTITSTTAFITSKVRKSLKRLLTSWFSGNSVQDFIVKGGSGSPDGRVEDERNLSFTESDDESGRRISASSALHGFRMHDKHYIKPGPCWAGNNPAFTVTMQAPQRRRKVSIDQSFSGTNTIVDEFVSYRIVTWFPDDVTHTSSVYPIPSSTYSIVTVDRRFTDFEWLHERLLFRFPPPVVALPQLPRKQLHLAKRFDVDHVERRRRGLEMYLNHLARHPVLRSEEVVMLFLSCGGEFASGLDREDMAKAVEGGERYGDGAEPAVVVEDEEWMNGMQQYDTEHRQLHNAGPANFFTRVQQLHPSEGGYPNMMDRFSAHLELVDTHLEPLIDSSQKHQCLVGEIPKHYETIANSLEVLARGRGEEGRLLRNLSWCWKRGCLECHEFSASMLSVSKQLHGIAELYDLHARTDLAMFNERVRDYQTLVNSFQALSQLNDVAETRYEELLDQHPHTSGAAHESITGMKRRLTTVCMVAQAEVERLHEEKKVEWERYVKDWLDGQISVQEKVLQHLKAAREAMGRTGCE